MAGLLDPVVGCCFLLLAVGLAPRLRGPAVLAAATGLLWFAGDLIGAAVLAHRGPLTHLLLGYPRRQARLRIALVVVAFAYVDALMLPLGRNSVVTLVLAALVLAVAAGRYRGARGAARRAQLVPVLVTVAVWGVLAVGATARLIGRDADAQVLLAYETVLSAGSVSLLLDTRYGRWSTAAITRLAVDLGHAPARSLRGRLADAVGDPSLVVGYPDAHGAFRDEAGQPVNVVASGSGRTVTALTDGDRTLAVLVHDSAVLGDRALLDAVTSLAKTTIANRHLEDETRVRYAAVEQSRRRLLSAVDEERTRLEAELHAGAQRQLEHAAKILRDLPDGGGQLSQRLAVSRAAISEFARGMHPRALTEAGLTVALAELARAATRPVKIDIPLRRFPDEVETAAYFICAEALANAAKYAHATHAEVLITVEHAQLVVAVSDNGCGGADSSRGSGLRGLADRVDVLGGTLAVESRTGAGTLVRAVLPLSSAALRAEAGTYRSGTPDLAAR